jgi:hypothetical protein
MCEWEKQIKFKWKKMRKKNSGQVIQNDGLSKLSKWLVNN